MALDLDKIETLKELLELYYDTDVDADQVIKAAYALGIKHGNSSK